MTTERDVLIRFIAAVDDHWDGDVMDAPLFRKLAEQARAVLFAEAERRVAAEKDGEQ